MIKKYGLDFGTTNSSVAVEEKGVGKVLEIDQKAFDKRVVRSMLYFPKREIVYDPKIPKARIANQVFNKGDFWYEGEEDPLIGQEAVEKYLQENKNRHQGVVRRIYTGRIINTETLQEAPPGPDTIREYYEEIDYGIGRLLQALKTALKAPSFKGTTVFGKFYSLEELIEVFVGEIKRVADEQLGQDITSIICGRPVHFSTDPQKDKAAQDRLESALKLVGFTDIKFELEPIAAAKQYIAKVMDSGQAGMTKKVLVFDFGGGTLDTAIVDSKDSKVLASDGVYIGGDLLNADIFEAKLWKYFGSEGVWGDYQLSMPLHIYEALKSWYSIPNLNNPEMMNLLQRVRYKNSDKAGLDRLIYLIKMNLGFDIYEAIENAKKELSSKDQSEIIYKNGLIEINEKITRVEFEQIIKERVEEIEQVIWRTLKSADLEAKDIDVVVRTGGSSLIPVFENLLAKIFGKEKIKQFENFTSIAGGLAIDSPD